MFCIKCGRYIDLNADYCGFCGSPNTKLSSINNKKTMLKDEIKRNKFIFCFSIAYFILRIILIVLSLIFAYTKTNSFIAAFSTVFDVSNSIIYGLFLGGAVVTVHTSSKKFKFVYLVPQLIFVIIMIIESFFIGIESTIALLLKETVIFIAIAVSAILQKNKPVKSHAFMKDFVLVLSICVLHSIFRIFIDICFSCFMYVDDIVYEFIMVLSSLIAVPISFFDRQRNLYLVYKEKGKNDDMQ